MYHLRLLQNFLKVNKSRQLKKYGRNDIVYILIIQIIQSSSLGRQQKNSVEHNDCFYVVSILQWRIRKTSTDNIIILQNYFQTNCQIITPMLIKSIGTTLGQYVF